MDEFISDGDVLAVDDDADDTCEVTLTDNSDLPPDLTSHPATPGPAGTWGT